MDLFSTELLLLLYLAAVVLWVNIYLTQYHSKDEWPSAYPPTQSLLLLVVEKGHDASDNLVRYDLKEDIHLEESYKKLRGILHAKTQILVLAIF